MYNYDRETVLNIEKSVEEWRLSLIRDIMDIEFEEFFWKYWYIIKNMYETEELLDLYIRKENSPFYYEKQEEGDER